MVSGSAEPSPLESVDAVVVVFEAVEAEHGASVALKETFCDLNRQPRTRKHTKPSSKFDRPVEKERKS